MAKTKNKTDLQEMPQGFGGAPRSIREAKPPKAPEPPQEVSKEQTFYNKVLGTAKKMGLSYPDMIAAQASLETGFGKSPLAINQNNYFGIKALPKGSKYHQPGQLGQVISSSEHIDGAMTNVDSRFRSYGSLEEALGDYSNKIATEMRYEGAKNATTPMGYVEALAKGGWATDPEYMGKILGIRGQYYGEGRISTDTYEAPPISDIWEDVTDVQTQIRPLNTEYNPVSYLARGLGTLAQKGALEAYETRSEKQRQRFGFVEDYHNQTVSEAKEFHDPTTGKTITVNVVGVLHPDKDNGLVYAVPGFDRDTQQILTEKQAQVRYAAAIRSGKIKGVPKRRANKLHGKWHKKLEQKD